MTYLFHNTALFPLIYQPLYNLLVFLYTYVSFHDFGIAIIIITLFLKLILMPLSKKQIESQKKMQEFQPRIKEIQNKYKGDKIKQNQAVMEFYKTNKMNPFGGCLPLIFQLFFLIAIYFVFSDISSKGLIIESDSLYSFIKNPGKINELFLGIIDLSRPNYFLAIFAAVSMFLQSKMLAPKQTQKTEKTASMDFSQIMSKQMLYMGPLLTLFIGVKFPSALVLYWLVSTLFAIGQQMYMENKFQLIRNFLFKK